MPPIVATPVYLIGIAGLFYLDRAGGRRVSKALWIPFIWLFLISSRPVFFLLNLSPSYATNATEAYVEGSPVDLAVYTLVMLAALAVLFSRAERPGSFGRKKSMLIRYFFFLLW